MTRHPERADGAKPSSSRDRRFIAVHRGGPLDRETHALLARWAADTAERVLDRFECRSDDERPREAIAVARAWADGAVRTGVAMKASLAAHAAAREAGHPAAVAAARAAGHAVATAHAADHCMGALIYALKALTADGQSIESEWDSRLLEAPASMREAVASGVDARMRRSAGS